MIFHGELDFAAGPGAEDAPEARIVQRVDRPLKVGVVQTLKNSARSWCVKRSLSRVFFCTVKSKFTDAGE